MNIDLTKLNSGLVDKITIDEKYDFNQEDLIGTDLKALDNVEVKGYITKDNLNNYLIIIDITGIMVLPCSITLKPVEYPFNIKIEGSLIEMLEEIDKKNQKIGNTIDILPVIWENILMEIPMKVVSEEVKNIKIKGNGWRLITEEDEKEMNPEFKKLKDLI